MTQSLNRILSLLDNRQRKQLWLVLAGVMLLGLSEVAGVASILPFMQLIAEPEVITQHPRIIPVLKFLGLSEQRSIIILAGFGVIGLIVLNSLISIGVNWLKQHRGWTFGHQISSRLLRAYLQKPYAYFLRTPSNEMVSLLVAEVTAYISGILFPFIDLTSKLFSSVIIFALLFYVSPLISITMTLVLGCFYGLIYVLQRRKLATLGKQRSALNIQRFKHMGEVFDGIKTVNAYNRQRFFYDYFYQASDAYSKIQPIYQVLISFPRSLLDILAFGTIVGITLMLYLNGNDLVEALPVLSLFAVAGYRLLPALQSIFASFGALRLNDVCIDRLQPLIGQQRSIQAELPHYQSIGPLTFQQQIHLKELTFAYSENQEPVLKNIDLSIPRGSTVAFVGPTGSGKTTLVDIVMGLLLPREGSVFIDEQQLTKDKLKNWRALTAYVPQDIFLFNDSIANNICMEADPENIDQAKLTRVLETAALSEFISELPEGVNTKVGPKGSRLSGGQRQRIGLARALYSDPQILVLDEATSALDNITEKQVVTAINQLGTRITTIIIAHRLSSVKRADRIYVLMNGQIIEQGTYEELLENKAVFSKMSLAAKKA